MQCVIVLPGALLPAAIASDVLREAQAPALSRLLADAGGWEHVEVPTDVPDLIDGAAHLAWLWNAFSRQRSLPISSPYARAALTSNQGQGHWWHCEPCHFAIARDHMLLEPASDIAPAELDLLFTDASACVDQWDAKLERVGQHWFIHTDQELHLEVAPLAAALGDSVDERMPRGDDAGRWRKLLTEIQISWHALALNEERENEGSRTVNAVWIHGGGQWRALPTSGFGAVRSDDLTLRGWALAAQVAPDAIFDLEAPWQAANGPLLTVDDSLFESFKMERWDAWLTALANIDASMERKVSQARAAGFDDIQVIATGRQSARRISLHGSDRAKFWRRWSKTPLASWLQEALAE